jgi:16S rRNA (guanine(966)-N(2))-methyltransferase RsmD
MFAMLEAAGADFTSVLDLYAGTGALGIEALSRGDGRCDFIEADARTAEVIRQNLARTALLDRGRVYHAQVAKAMSRLAGPYTLVVADPPYEYDRAQAELANLIEHDLLAAEGFIVVEHSKRHDWPESLGGLTKVDSRRYGDTKVSLYRRG